MELAQFASLLINGSSHLPLLEFYLVGSRLLTSKRNFELA